MKNNKGFMMAEVVIVSSIALIALSSLYISYNKIYSAYLTRINYNDMKSLNRLVFFRDLLIEDCDLSHKNCKINSLLQNAKEDSNKKLQNISGDINLNEANDYKNEGIISETTFLYHNQKDHFDETIFEGIEVNQTYKEYVNYLKESADFRNTNYVMLIERCYTEDDCKYAYLDVYD